jgi:hypothetical protein
MMHRGSSSTVVRIAGLLFHTFANFRSIDAQPAMYLQQTSRHVLIVLFDSSTAM